MEYDFSNLVLAVSIGYNLYTDHFLVEAASRASQKIAVICPGFSVDCLETLEEIGSWKTKRRS